MKPQSRAVKPPPAECVSPELLELVIRWLRKRYGDRPVNGHVLYCLNYQLGDIEREYVKDSNAAAVART